MKRLCKLSVLVLALSNVVYAAPSFRADLEQPGRVILNSSTDGKPSGVTVECQGQGVILISEGGSGLSGEFTSQQTRVEVPLKSRAPSLRQSGQVIVWFYNRNAISAGNVLLKANMTADSAKFTCDASSALKITLSSGLEFIYPHKPQ